MFRDKTREIQIGNVKIGGGKPIAIQSMTNTETSDVDATVAQILELEKDSLYNKYVDKVGTVISAEVYQIWKKEMLLIDDEGNELLLPKSEQIPSDYYRKGETARALVLRVDNTNNNPNLSY